MASTKHAVGARRRPTDAEIDAQIPAAREREQRDVAAGLRATSARYDEASGRVMLELSNGIALAFPAAMVRGLEHATAAQRAQLALTPSGAAVLWDALSADISVPGVIARWFGQEVAAVMGKAGGKARTPAKAKASQANGAKGGRPRKNA